VQQCCHLLVAEVAKKIPAEEYCQEDGIKSENKKRGQNPVRN
jgi:hypothetical protein